MRRSQALTLAAVTDLAIAAVLAIVAWRTDRIEFALAGLLLVAGAIGVVAFARNRV